MYPNRFAQLLLVPLVVLVVTLLLFSLSNFTDCGMVLMSQHGTSSPHHDFLSDNQPYPNEPSMIPPGESSYPPTPYRVVSPSWWIFLPPYTSIPPGGSSYPPTPYRVVSPSVACISMQLESIRSSCLNRVWTYVLYCSTSTVLVETIACKHACMVIIERLKFLDRQRERERKNNLWVIICGRIVVTMYAFFHTC